MKVSVVIVTYNGLKWIDKCLSGFRTCVIPLEIIIVDNGSSDGTKELIQTNYPGADLIEATENLGFGKANNIALLKAFDAGADFVFLLNQDAWVQEGSMERLLDAASSNPEYGIISPIHLSGDGKRLDFRFSAYAANTKDHKLLQDLLLQDKLSVIYELPFVNGAAWLISRSCFNKTGLFDPLFFHYGEDANYCQRVLYHGFKIGIVPGAFINHDREQKNYLPLTDLKTSKTFSAYQREFYIQYADVCLSWPKQRRRIRNEILRLLRMNLSSLLKLRLKESGLLLKKTLFILRHFNKIKHSHTVNRIHFR